MSRFVHVVESEYKETFRTAKISSMFDVSPSSKLTKKWEINFPIEEKDWQIGLIVGASGSGKTTLAKKIFGNKIHEAFTWKSASMVDDFDSKLSVGEITQALSKVGFSSPPSWLLPFNVLSNGQKFRAEMARALLEYDDLFVMDEFTSVVDRQAAQIGSFAFQKAIRQNKNKKFVAVTCHYDVSDWLQPDWILDVSSNEFSRRSLRRPEVELEIFRVNYKAWELFKEHHYLSAEINKSSFCFVGCINKTPVVFDSWLPFFGRTSSGKKAMRGHRTVCLPDYQGIGLGNAIFSELARMWSGLGYDVFSCTAHPAEINKRISSGEWKLNAQGRVSPDNKIRNRATNRLTSRFTFVGKPMSVSDAVKLRGN